MMTHTIIASILADIQTGEFWWTEVAKKHGVTFQLVWALGTASQPYSVILCGQCGGTGKHAQEACKRCGGEGVAK